MKAAEPIGGALRYGAVASTLDWPAASRLKLVEVCLVAVPPASQIVSECIGWTLNTLPARDLDTNGYSLVGAWPLEWRYKTIQDQTRGTSWSKYRIL